MVIMGKSVILHDRRLAGGAPIGRGITTIRLDGSTSLSLAFSAIKTLVRLDGVQNLYILWGRPKIMEPGEMETLWKLSVCSA
jgi:hypothetical protein